jgi:Flp pilus assembly protein TadD
MVERNPDNDRYHFTLGALYDEAKDRDASMAEMRRAIELNPQNAAALNYLGYTFADMGVQLDEAEDLIRRAIALDPNDGFYVDSLGWVYYQRGEYQKAVEELEHALELAGEDPTISEHLGDAYRQTGRAQEALRVYRDALSRSKEKDQVERIKGKIEVLDGGRPADGKDS